MQVLVAAYCCCITCINWRPCNEWLLTADYCCNACREHVAAASPALLRQVGQVVLVTCQHDVQQLAKQLPDPAMHQPCLPHQLIRLRTCKKLLMAMQVCYTTHSQDPGLPPECTSMYLGYPCMLVLPLPVVRA